VFTTNFYDSPLRAPMTSDYDDENEGELIGSDDEELTDDEDFPADGDEEEEDAEEEI